MITKTTVGIYDIKLDGDRDEFILKYHIGKSRSVVKIKNGKNKEKEMFQFMELFRREASQFLMEQELQNKPLH